MRLLRVRPGGELQVFLELVRGQYDIEYVDDLLELDIRVVLSIASDASTAQPLDVRVVCVLPLEKLAAERAQMGRWLACGDVTREVVEVRDVERVVALVNR